MKLLFVGDPHIHIGNLDVSKKFLDKLEEITNDKKPDVVLLAGDLFHTHSIIRSEVMNLWIGYLEKATIPHIALVGNHDQVSPGSPIHALTSLKKFAKVVDKPYKMANILFLPYVHTSAEFEEMLKQRGDADALFCHQTFDGAQYENGFYAPDGFSLALVSGFKSVISGHIHKRQHVGNVWYPGTPFQHNFNDAGERKAVWLIDTDTHEYSSLELGLPEFYIWGETPETIIGAFKGVLEDEVLKQSSYKVVLRGSKAEVTALQDSREFKELRKQLKLMVSPEYADVVPMAERISDSVTPEQMMEVYVSSIMKTELDKKVLLEMSSKLLRGESV